MVQLTENAQSFLARKPTYIGTYKGNKYYEHPELGDEACLQCITKDGKYKRSSCWDMESVRQLGESEF
jgi:hypothetical protein